MKAFILGLLTIFWSNLAMGQTLYTFNGGGTSGNWDDAQVWTTDPTGSTRVGARVPASSDNVVITNSFVLRVNNAVAATGLNVTVQKGGVLELTTTASPFGTLARLAGQGTLRIAQAYFPAVTTNDFDDANTGTVEFYNWPAGIADLPQPGSNLYNNLRLVNTTTTGYTALVANNLTINGNLALVNATYVRTTSSNPGNPGGNVTLNLGKTASNNRTLTVNGDVTVGGGTNLGVTAVNAKHILAVSGSFVNNGTVNLHRSTNDAQVALLRFTGSTDANFACNGPTDLDVLEVNKGIDSQALLNVTSTPNPNNNLGNLRLLSITDGADILRLINGVTKLGNNIVLGRIHNGNGDNTDSANWFEIGSSTTSPTLWVAGATVINDNATTFVIYGTLRVSGGKLQTLTPDAMVVREDGQILIEGGEVFCEKLRPSLTSANHRGSFIMTGGVLECRGSNPNAAADGTDFGFARFSVPYLTQAFRMSGGIIRVYNQNNNYSTGLFHVGVNPDNVQVTGGTIEVYLPATSNNGNILTTAPLWNLTIKKTGSAGTSKAVLADVAVPVDNPYSNPRNLTPFATTTARPLTVLNNFTIDGTNPTAFDANTQNVNIQGTFTIAQGGTYLPGTNTTTFSGGQNQLLTNNGTVGTNAATNTFTNFTVDKSAGTLTLAGTNPSDLFTVAGTLSLLNGVLSDGGKTVNALGNVVNSASHTSGGGSGSIVLAGAVLQTVSGDGTGVFGNLRINNSTLAAGAIAARFTANMSVANQLNLQSNHVLAIGANRLSITNIAQNAITSPGGGNSFSNTRFIQTAGNQSDLGLQRTYGGTVSQLFPVGTGTKYTPASITLSSATVLARYGQVSVSPANMRNPFLSGTNNALKYYWKVRSVGFGAFPPNTMPVSATFTMQTADAANTTAGSTAGYIPGFYTASTVSWRSFNNTSLVLPSPPTADISFNSLSQFDGEYTAGLPAAFGPVTAYYSRNTGTWEALTTWSTDQSLKHAGTAATAKPGPGNPVFIGSAADGLNHVVTVTGTGATAATSGSLVIDNGSTLDVGVTTGHNFGALPDAKVGGSGVLRVSSSAAAVTFPGGDFGSFLLPGGGTVEYYTTGTQDFTLPLVSTTTGNTLSLVSYRNLWLNPGNNRTITMPDTDLRVYEGLSTGTLGTTNGVVMLNGLANNVANRTLRVDGTLTVQNGALRFANRVAQTVTVNENVQVNAGATFDVGGTGAAVLTNAITVAGSVTNNGTLDLNATSAAALTFTGANNTKLTGSTGTLTHLYKLTVNKGTSRTPTLTVDVAGTLDTPGSNWLTLTNGTLSFTKTNGVLNIHNATTPYLITDNAGLTVNAPTATVNVATGGGAVTNNTTPANNTSSPSDLKLAGELQVLQGTLNVGTANGLGNDIEYASAGAPTIRVATGGALYVNGQVRRTTANTNGSLRYDQSGGTAEIGGARATVYQNNERGVFEVQGPNSIFRMTGGTLALRGTNGRPTIIGDLYLAPDSTVVTAPSLVVLGNTTAVNVTVSVASYVPLYDLKVENGTNSTNTGLLTGRIPLTLKGSLTIANDNAFFNANGLGLNIAQNLINNNSSTNTGLNDGGFRPATADQTTTFTGGLPTQQLSSTTNNLTVFGSLVVNNAQTNGALQLGRNARVIGTLTLAKGTLDDNGQTLTSLGDVVNNTAHVGSGRIVLAGTTNQNLGGNGLGRFANVELNNAQGVTSTADQQIAGVLTLTNGVFTIGSKELWLSNPSAAAVTGASAMRFIRTNGIVADLGLRKSYPASASNFTFPVGAASKYTPVQMNVTANTTAGTLTVQPIDVTHPSTTDPALASKALSFYWKVASTGFNAASTVTQQFNYVDADLNGNEADYVLGRFLNGKWVPQDGIANTVNAANNTLTNSGVRYFEGDYTGGEPSEFGDVPTFYSRNATAGQATGANWDNPTAWTFNSDGTVSSPAPGAFPTLANPVFIRSGHLINTNGSGREAASLDLQGTLDLGTGVANNFNNVTGTGTLRIGSALFPAGKYTPFMAATGGTVDYTGAVTLPAIITYNNLTLSGGTAKQLSNIDLTLNGALTVAANTLVDNPNSQNLTLTSATSGATVGGTFNLNDGQLTTAGSLATATGGTLNLGAGDVSVGTTFTNAGTLNNGSGLLTVNTAFGNSGTFNANAGTGALTVGTTFTNSGGYNAGAGKLLVNSNFTNTAAGTFTPASGDVTVLGSFANAGSYASTDVSHLLRVTGDFTNTNAFTAGTSTLILRGNFANSGSGFDAGSSLVQFITEGNRSLNGNATFHNLQKVGPNVLSFGTNTSITVSNLLTLQNGLIATGAGTTNTLYLTNSAVQPVVNSGPTSYIDGRVAMTQPNTTAALRTFPVGLRGRYRPVTIKQGTNAGNPVVLVEIINGKPVGGPDNISLSNLSANRYYRIQLVPNAAGSLGTLSDPSVQISFNTDVEDEKVNVPGNLRVAYASAPLSASTLWASAGGSGVFSPDAPRGYTTSGQFSTTIDGNSFFALGSTNFVDNPLTGAAPLPVELLQFTAVRQGAQVRVVWATASEKNSAYFQVQRSATGSIFADIQRVEAQGTSTSRHDYATMDARPLSGLSYYRLRQVDHDGKETYSPMVAVRFEGQPGAAPTLVAYPNPASGQGFHLLTTDLGLTGGTVRLIDNVGRLVLTQVVAPGTAEATIQPARPLASGIYFATWQSAEGVKLTTKVAVE